MIIGVTWSMNGQPFPSTQFNNFIVFNFHVRFRSLKPRRIKSSFSKTFNFFRAGLVRLVPKEDALKIFVQLLLAEPLQNSDPKHLNPRFLGFHFY